jgi:hypothetical protein
MAHLDHNFSGDKNFVACKVSAVIQGTREVGIRMAPGAKRGELARLFVGYGLPDSVPAIAAV